MKKLALTALVAMCSLAVLPPAMAANGTDNTAKKAAPKKATKKTTKKAAPKKTVAAPPAQPEEGSALWACKESEKLYIKGDMKRDQILTMFWEGRNYRLPRQQTTTGADRFYDAASGMDLVVIPAKAMLFKHARNPMDDTRLADECKTQEMIDHDKLAPTQSVELLK